MSRTRLESDTAGALRGQGLRCSTGEKLTLS